MGIKHIAASNGNGEAVRASVTQIRAVGSTVLKPDVHTNFPDFFIATTGSLLTNGSLDPSSATVFFGHLDGDDIIIDEFAPGYEDIGNSVGEVILIKPTTAWADAIAEILGKALTDDGAVAQVDHNEPGLKFVVSATEPSPDPDSIILWFEPLES